MASDSARCINSPVCPNRTGHSSGYCERCRTRKCVDCGVGFVLTRRKEMGASRCSAHRIKERRSRERDRMTGAAIR